MVSFGLKHEIAFKLSEPEEGLRMLDLLQKRLKLVPEVLGPIVLQYQHDPRILFRIEFFVFKSVKIGATVISALPVPVKGDMGDLFKVLRERLMTALEIQRDPLREMELDD